MADNHFTFWENMKETIDTYEGNPEYQYRLYDALTEYALYGIWPEEDGTIETKGVIAFVQSMIPSIDKSKNFYNNAAEAGMRGGRAPKVSDDEIKISVEKAAEKKGGIPTRNEVVEALYELTGIRVSTKTISRRLSDAEKREISLGTLGQNEDISYVPGDKNNVPKNDEGDISNVPVRFNF